MHIYVFCDALTREAFALTTDMTGRNVPQRTAQTRWVFTDSFEVKAVPERWSLAANQEVMDRLKEEGYYIFERKRRGSVVECR
jgi:hypothetical protein